jgi:hypothetical protein
MNPNLKIFLIVLAFVVITVLVFSPYYCPDPTTNEHYVASFDPLFVDPRVNPYSKNITYRPDSPSFLSANDDPTSTPVNQIDDPTGTPFNRVYDHLDAMDLAVNSPARKQKRVRFADEKTYPVARRTNNHYPGRLHGNKPVSGDHVNNTNIKTSFSNTQINMDRVNETNNIVNYCMHGQTLDDHGMVYSDNPDGMIDPEILSGSLQAPIVPEHQIQEPNNHEIQGLNELSDVIDKYRNNALNTIQESCRGPNNYRDNIKMYDRIY